MRKIVEAGLCPDKLTVNNVDFVKAGMCPTCYNRMTTETGTVSPAEVKAMWLERKLASLKPAIAGEGKDNAMKSLEYGVVHLFGGGQALHLDEVCFWRQKDPSLQRTEQRVISLLIRAIPANIKETIVSERLMTSSGITLTPC